MGKSSRTGRRNGTVTVIETRVHRNSARNARLAFVLAAIFVGGIATVAASQWTQPVLSLLIGIAIGVVAGAICWTAVRVWPVVRVIWWWLGELARLRCHHRRVVAAGHPHPARRPSDRRRRHHRGAC